jgi:biopolymer transport protein ExbB/TolQ
VAGLAIAIPALASYYWLQARVDRYVHEIDGLVVDITETADLSPAGV